MQLDILDRYIIRKYLTTFGFTLLILTLIACVIDFSEKVDNFIREPITRFEIFQYFATFIPFINTMLVPLYALIAVIFFTSRMANDSEVISIFNAGVSFRRFLRPFMLAAGGIALVHLALTHLIVPMSNKIRVRIENKYIWKDNDKGKSDNVHLFLDPHNKVYVQNYRKADSTARDFRIEKLDSTGFMREIIKSSNARYLGKEKKWRLEGYTRRTFSGLHETFSPDNPPLDTALALAPEDFVQYANQNEMLTTPELYQLIQKQRTRGAGKARKYEIELHRRTAEPFTILILTLIGVAMAARKVRGGVGLHLAVGIGVGAVFIFLSRFVATIAMQPDVPVFLGVWTPNLIFGGVAAYMLSRAQQ
jgi:lipopolysaccharide export system permease protein